MVRTLSVLLSEELPFILVEKKRRLAPRVVKSGLLLQEKGLNLKAVNRIVCEFPGCRLVQDDAFADLQDALVKDSLTELIGKAGENTFSLRRVSKTYAATLRSSRYGELLDQLGALNLKPHLLAPQHLGLFCAIRNKYKDGFFSLSSGSGDYVFLLENGTLKYLATADKTDLVKQRFLLKTGPETLTSKDLGLPEVEPKYGSLLGLALFSKMEKEPFNFLDLTLIDEALEKERMRHSITIAAALTLPIIAIALGTNLWARSYEKESKQSEIHYQVFKKRAEKVKVLESDATKALTDIMKFHGAGGASGSLTGRLLSLTQCAPDKLTLTNLEEERSGNVFTITGITPDLAAVFEYEANLKAGIYKKAKVLDTRKIKREGEEAVLFRISAVE